jgi:hypothetical protein
LTTNFLYCYSTIEQIIESKKFIFDFYLASTNAALLAIHELGEDKSDDVFVII